MKSDQRKSLSSDFLSLTQERKTNADKILVISLRKNLTKINLSRASINLKVFGYNSKHLSNCFVYIRA